MAQYLIGVGRDSADRSPSDRVREAHWRLDSLAQSVAQFLDWMSDESFPPTLAGSLYAGLDRDAGSVRSALGPLASTARRLAHDGSYLESVFGVLPVDSAAFDRLAAAVASLTLTDGEVVRAREASDARHADVLRWSVMTRVVTSAGFQSLTAAKQSNADVRSLRDRVLALVRAAAVER